MDGFGWIIAIIALVALVAVSKMLKDKSTVESVSGYPFEKRRQFLSPAERSFYGVLKVLADQRGWDVFAKIRLEDVVEVRKGTEKLQAHRNRIKSRHVDFLLCDHETVSPLLAIELNDASHASERRQERDAFLTDALSAAGIALLTVPARSAYSVADLGRMVDEKLGIAPATTAAESPEPAPVQPAASKPAGIVCPKCGSPMVERQNRKTGERFLGCSSYPACHHIQAIEGAATH